MEKAEIRFDGCPAECGYTTYLRDLESDTDDTEDYVEHLERAIDLFEFDTEAYIRKLASPPNSRQKPTQEEKNKHSRNVPPHYLSTKSIRAKPISTHYQNDALGPRHRTHCNFKPVDCKVYPLTELEQVALEEFFTRTSRTGRIRTSRIPNGLTILLHKKKDGSSTDPRLSEVNDATIKNRYPLPLISELVDKLKGSKIFTKSDVRCGYQ